MSSARVLVPHGTRQAMASGWSKVDSGSSTTGLRSPICRSSIAAILPAISFRPSSPIAHSITGSNLRVRNLKQQTIRLPSSRSARTTSQSKGRHHRTAIQHRRHRSKSRLPRYLHLFRLLVDHELGRNLVASLIYCGRHWQQSSLRRWSGL